MRRWLVVVVAMAGCGRVDFDPATDSQPRLALGYAFTCFLRPSGSVICWGAGARGHLGHGNTADIGDDETPASAGDVPLDAKVLSIVSSISATTNPRRPQAMSVAPWSS